MLLNAVPLTFLSGIKMNTGYYWSPVLSEMVNGLSRKTSTLTQRGGDYVERTNVDMGRVYISYSGRPQMLPFPCDSLQLLDTCHSKK